MGYPPFVRKGVSKLQQRMGQPLRRWVSCKMKMRIVIVTILLLWLGIIGCVYNRLPDSPKIILWAWEHPQDLRFIDPHKVGVAFLIGTLYLKGDNAIVRPRFQPLKVPEGTLLIAVVRIEPGRFEKPSFSSDQCAKAVSKIIELTNCPGIAALQIDFDTTVSQRAFCRRLLSELKRELAMPVSITALASWCIWDDWISELPIDEAVPMLFRMGQDHHQIILCLKKRKDFRVPIARHSVGISTDEPIFWLPKNRKIYIFHPGPWSCAAFETIIKEVKKWQ